ncbi:MAG: NAD(P)-dependent oxidoreductase [Fermentimonas sp.]|nr:NAD(P)-dependent oxidoreductase [Fermentimonas sp.]
MINQINNKKVLITGASGFIGSTAVDKALELGHETWAGIRKSSSRKYLSDSRIQFTFPDYSNKESLKNHLKELVEKHGKFDYIIHIAGLTKALHKSDFDKVNYEQTRNLAESLIEIDAVPEAFVLMSSLSALGTGDEKNYTPINSNHIPNPTTAYGKSKLKAENFLKGLKNFPYLIIRPTGVYGPRDKDYFILMKAVKGGLNVGAGFKKQVLTFIYSEDLVDVIFKLLEKGIVRKEYIVADGNLYTDSEFNQIVQDALDKKHVVRLKIPLFIVKPAAWISEKATSILGKASTFNSDKYRIMKQRNWACDITPLKEDINFEPKYRLKQGVEKTVKWYKDNGWL